MVHRAKTRYLARNLKRNRYAASGSPLHFDRMFGFGSAGGTRAIPNYGPVSAAKAILEAHIRQLDRLRGQARIATVKRAPRRGRVAGKKKIDKLLFSIYNIP